MSQPRRSKTFFWKQAEERLRSSVVASGPDATHGLDHVILVQGVDKSSASKLRSAVGVNDSASDVAAAGDRAGQGLGGQS